MSRSALGPSALVVFTFTILATSWSAALPLYKFTAMEDMPGGAPDTDSMAVNNSGQVTGQGYVIDSKTHAFLWQPNTANGTIGTQFDLSQPGDYTSAWAMNDVGQVAGQAIDANFKFNSFLWTPQTANGTTGHMINLGDLPGRTNGSIAYGINGYGQVAGVSTGAAQRAYLWTPTTKNGESGSMVDLGDLPGGRDFTTAKGINASGQVVGSSETGDGFHAMLWTPNTTNGTTGVMVDLGTLPAMQISAANAINASGQVVGTSNNFGNAPHAFLWTPTTPNGSTGSMIDLGSVPNVEANPVPSSINSSGWVVGTTGTGPNSRAFLWTPASGMVDLNTLLQQSDAQWTLVNARSINDVGQIAGVANYDPDGEGGVRAYPRGFLLTPTQLIPEPGAMLLALLSSGALLRRRARS